MGKSQRDKGARGEREAAAHLTEHTGVEWRRGIAQSRRGGREAADVEIVEAKPRWSCLHIEVKRGVKVSVTRAMRQAVADAEARGLVPMVLWREDRKAWMVTMEVGALRTGRPVEWSHRAMRGHVTMRAEHWVAYWREAWA